ncbi:MAG TPA: DUF3891 family protein [Thermodesulfobacteriota bacterium]|nr:DUF3891 family protein [Thermodesulfobacteriota bacterium]
MIRREVEEGWILINQYDHARLSGEIMRYWGNEEFAMPDPYDEVLLAIGEHDNGWREWDSLPKVNPLSRFPMNFLEMDSLDQAEIWKRCFKRHSLEHPYASALIALHFGKLNEKSLSRDSNNTIAMASHMEIIDFVSNTLEIAIQNLDVNSLPEDVRVNLRFVQIGDVISLALCHGWPSIEIKDVPVEYSGRSVTLDLRSKGGNDYVVTPYPFAEPLIRLRVNGRRLCQKEFSRDDELRERLRESRYETLEFSIRRE